MKIVEEKLYNRLVPTEKTYLVDKEELERYEKEEEKFELNYSKEIFLPKSVTLDYCLAHYVETEEIKGDKIDDNRLN